MQHVELRTDDGNDYDEHEREANIFAGSLLIPEKLLDQEYKKFLVTHNCQKNILMNPFCFLIFFHLRRQYVYKDFVIRILNNIGAAGFCRTPTTIHRRWKKIVKGLMQFSRSVISISFFKNFGSKNCLWWQH